MTSFRSLTSTDELDAAVRASASAPIILFKHSETCGISLMVRDDLAAAHVPAPLHEVVVQRYREVSTRIATQFGVRHESPQVLIVVRGAVAWHTSHQGVTARRIDAAWNELAATFTAQPAGTPR